MDKKKNDKENKFTLTEFFCGAGGLGLGMKQAGLNILKAYDFDKYAVQSYKHNVDENVEQASVLDLKGDDIPKSDVWTFGFPCFPAGTTILCKDGMKYIEDVKEGDYVLTHKNRWKKVVHTMSRFSPTVQLESDSNTIVTTEEHPFYALKTEDSAIEWIKAKDMKDNYWASPIRFESIEKPYLYSEESIELYYLLGYFMYNTKFVNNQLHFNIDKDSKIREFLIKLDITFALNKKDEYKQFAEYVITSEKFNHWFSEIYRDELVPTWLLTVEDEYKQSFLNGFVNSQQYVLTDGFISLDIHNKKNAYLLKMLFDSLTYNTILTHFDISPLYNNVNVVSIFSLHVEQPNQNERIKKENQYFEKVYNYISTNKEELVYNFEVEDDNSYVADGVTVHNCQDISVAGKMAGMVKGKTRSGLFYEIMRLLEESKPENKPKVILAENVKQVKNYFEEIEKEFKMQGYTFTYVLYNSKYFNVAQNRERYFMIGIHESVLKEFTFKEQPNNEVPPLSQFLEKDVDAKYYLSIEKAKTIIENALRKTKELSLNETHATLNPSRIIMRQNGRRMKKNEEPMFTLTATEVHGVVERKINGLGLLDIRGTNSLRRTYGTDGIAPTLTTAQGGNMQVKILEAQDVDLNMLTDEDIENLMKYFTLRKLTPREYARLQGFPDNFEQIVSNSQFYKQMGNAVTVTVAKYIGEQIIEFLEEVK